MQARQAHRGVTSGSGLDGLRAEERPRKERAPLTRARKLLYTVSALAIIAVLYVVWSSSRPCWRLRRSRCAARPWLKPPRWSKA